MNSISWSGKWENFISLAFPEGLKYVAKEENSMTEEKGNTVQEYFDSSEIPYPAEEVFSGMIGKLHSEFYGIGGKFVVTIEFYPDSEVEDE